MENNELKIKIGARIKELRTELGLTQEEFAKKIGVSGKTIIANYESGYSTPNDEVRMKICSVCNCSMDYLTCQSNTRSNNESNNDEIQVAFSSGFAGLNEENKKLAVDIIAGLKAKQDLEGK